MGKEKRSLSETEESFVLCDFDSCGMAEYSIFYHFCSNNDFG